MQITGKVHQVGVAAFRIAVGIIFFWAGLEKFLGPEPFSASGFLSHATGGSLGWPFITEAVDGAIYNPTHDFWVSLSTNAGAMSIVNFLVVAGEIGIGIALILGLFTRFAGAMGTIMMLLFFVAAWDFTNGIVNQHLTYALVCATLTGIGAGRYYGLDGVLASRVPAFVNRYLMSGAPADEPGSPRVSEPVTA
jgi:thiosulfate dehydrogenase [quinone] large subunit